MALAQLTMALSAFLYPSHDLRPIISPPSAPSSRVSVVALEARTKILDCLWSHYHQFCCYLLLCLHCEVLHLSKLNMIRTLEAATLSKGEPRLMALL